MKKRLLSILLLLALCAALLPTIALADAPALSGAGTPEDPWILKQESFSETNTSEDSNPKWNPFFGSGYYSLSSGSYKLGSDVKLESEIRIRADNSVSLDLAGHTLSAAYEVIPIRFNGETASLTLNDSSSEQSGKLVGSNYAVYHAKGTFILNGGQLTANKTTVMNNSGTLHLNGGEIGGTGTAIENSGTILVDAGKEGTRVKGKVWNRGTIEGGCFYDEVTNGGFVNKTV